MIPGYQDSVMGDKGLCTVHQDSHFETRGNIFRSGENKQPQGGTPFSGEGRVVTLDESLQKSKRN